MCNPAQSKWVMKSLVLIFCFAFAVLCSSAEGNISNSLELIKNMQFFESFNRFFLRSSRNLRTWQCSVSLFFPSLLSNSLYLNEIFIHKRSDDLLDELFTAIENGKLRMNGVKVNKHFGIKFMNIIQVLCVKCNHWSTEVFGWMFRNTGEKMINILTIHCMLQSSHRKVVVRFVSIGNKMSFLADHNGDPEMIHTLLFCNNDRFNCLLVYPSLCD